MSINTHSIDLEKSSSQYLSITDAAQSGLDITGDITFEAWIKLEQLPSTAGDTFQIISKNATNQKGYEFHIRSSDDTLRVRYHCTLGGATNSYLYMNEAFDSDDIGEWIHVAAAIDVSAVTGSFYKNGILKASTVFNNACTSIINNSAEFKIGAQESTATNFFDGKIDEARVWSDIRTASEIANNYNKELLGTESNLEGYWKLNNNLSDSGPNSNTLTNNNSATFSTDVPFAGEEDDQKQKVLNGTDF